MPAPSWPITPSPNWPGDGSARDAADGNTGILVGDTTAANFFTASPLGQVFSFDGAHRYVDIGNPANLRLGTNLTLEAWVDPAVAPSAGRGCGIFAVVTKWGQNAGADAYGLWVSGGQALGAVGVRGVSEIGFEGGSVPVGQWSHVAMTYERASGQALLDVDGRSVATVRIPDGVTASSLHVEIG